MDIKNTLSELQSIGLTQNQIASFIGCSQSTISDMSAGKVGTVRPSYQIVCGIQKLAKKNKIKIQSKKLNAQSQVKNIV